MGQPLERMEKATHVDRWVRLTNPQILGALSGIQSLEEGRVFRLLLLGPFLVVLEDAVMALLEILLDLLWGLLVEFLG